MSDLKMYVAVLDEFPDFMVPTLVAHSILAAHKEFLIDSFMNDSEEYGIWYEESFKKVVVRVNQKEFDKISALTLVHLGHENNTLEGKKSCAVVCPRHEIPNVLKFAKLWKPKIEVNVDFEQGYKALLFALQMIASEGDHIDRQKFAEMILLKDWTTKIYGDDQIYDMVK